MEIELTRFVSGGYFITREGNPGWEQLKELLPDRLISLSSHICPQFSVSWGWITGNRQAALDFGVRASQIDEFVAWCGTDYREDMDIWSMFYSPVAANRFINRFIEDRQGLHIVGAGLPLELEVANWRWPGESEGIEKRVEQRLPMAEGGRTLGFELLRFSHNNFDCSWLCTYLHQDMHRLFGIVPGEFGLIQREVEAQTVYAWIAEDERKRHADPIIYDYWLLVDYPLDHA
ncbi:MAG: hypothetical protein IPM16_20690 [Chloroflexi bacterium]|nr:hypothetical protein [Chloroflexota bacterium]